MFKRLYHMLALIALINLFAIGGLVGYMFVSGRLNHERVDQIGVVLRGQFPTSQPTTQPDRAAPPEASRTEIARLAAQKEYFELFAQRHQREIEDRRTLNQSIQFDVNTKLEEIEKREAAFVEQQKKLAQQSQQDGFARTLEVYSKIDPAKAKELLRNPPNKDADVVQYLMKMDANRVQKIANACKTKDELDWIGRILNQITLLNKEPGAGVDGPKPSSIKGG